MTTHKISGDGTTAVDPDYYWRSLDTCPRGVSVWLLTRWGRAIDGQWGDKTLDIVAWCPKPKIPQHIKELMT
jgi:hypothetical protein